MKFKKQYGNASIIAIVVLGIFMVSLLMYIIPQYRVWEQGLAGEAALAKAEQTKTIMIETAKAEEQAAAYRANAMAILGEMAKTYPEYRQQEFMLAFGEALREGNISQILYVPTEGNIPITEAGKR